MSSDEIKEEGLDPEDWEALRLLGHRMVDDMVAYLRTLRERPVWRSVPTETRERLRAGLPEEGEDPERIYNEFVNHILPYPTGNLHPRFWGWVKGTGTPFAMLAEMLAAGMNCNVQGFDDSASLVEEQVISWFKSMLEYPREASGLLVSGCSMANLVGLAVARRQHAGADAQRAGLSSLARPMTLELLGLGSDALRLIETDDRFRIDLNALARAIARDRASGCQPFCVVGNAGSVNTGAIDDLAALADLAEREGLWLHVDGAFGAWAFLCDEYRAALKYMARADSLAFDLHKWMSLPYEIGCTLVRDDAAHHTAFDFAADYLKAVPRGAAAGGVRFSEYGLQLSRGFRALKAWMSLKEHGRRKLARQVAQNIAQARYLASLIAAAPELELLAPVAMNVVCFRYAQPGASEAESARINREVLFRLQEEGTAVCSSTMIRDRFALRVAAINHRSRRADYDALVAAVLRLGRALV
jgi:glutamate/tyrosine decarboxylase-like PLP-dependent enzyme